MRILYATYRYNPQDIDGGSGMDYGFYTAIKNNGMEVKVVGPITTHTTWIEKIEKLLGKIYRKFTRRSYLKFPLLVTWRASLTLNEAERRWKPDVVFTLFPPFLVFYKGSAPCVWRLDTTFLGQEAEWPLYGRLPLRISVWEERRALSKVARVMTTSEWSKQILIRQYGVDEERIEIFPPPAAIPSYVVPDQIDVLEQKHLTPPLRLLLVGREYKRKGVDIAIKITTLLNEQGIPTELTVCGLREKPEFSPPYVKFVGPYRKSDPKELREYVRWYEWAHLLIHPARFEAAGIVPSEAAGFGTPTITNDVGGLSTTVRHGESGLVLPKGSPPEVYVQAIKELVAHPDQYYALCEKARQRYERELNWEIAGKRLVQILRKVVEGNRH